MPKPAVAVRIVTVRIVEAVTRGQLLILQADMCVFSQLIIQLSVSDKNFASEVVICIH